MTHFLTDPWAEHPVVNRHICRGEGGGDTFKPGTPPSIPDYSAYISEMTKVGKGITEDSKKLINWARSQGLKLEGIADTVSGRAGAMADEAKGTYSDMMANWKKTYEPLYEAQAKEAGRMIGDLGNVKEQEAGRQSAAVAQAFDASREAHDRSLRSYGLKAPGSGSQQLDSLVSNQRGLAQVAAGEQGRRAAEDTAWKRVGEAQQAGLVMPEIANRSAATGLAAGNQQVGAPESAVATTTGAYSPGISMKNAAFPWMKQWGDTMATDYNQRLAGYSAYNTAMARASEAEAAANSGGGALGMLGGLAGTVAGSFLGPMGGAIGGKLGSMAGGLASGSGMTFEEGGQVEGGDQMVDPSMSASQGAITDDVPARLNVGEFVFPKDVVEWRGEAWFQKEIAKARKERQQHTVAEPEMGPASAIDTQAPAFQSPQEPPL